MGVPFVNLYAHIHLVALGGLGQHALDGVFQNSLRLGVSEHFVGFSRQSAGAARRAVMSLCFPLLAGQDNFLGVDDDHMVPIFQVGLKVDFVLAAQNRGDL